MCVFVTELTYELRFLHDKEFCYLLCHGLCFYHRQLLRDSPLYLKDQVVLVVMYGLIVTAMAFHDIYVFLFQN